MSKLNIGVGEEFPLDDDPKQSDDRHPCAQYRRHGRHRRHRGAGPVAALFILPAAAASVTAAILYPLATLGVIGGLGVAAAAHRRSRWHTYREAYRDAYRARQDEGPQADAKPGDKQAPPKETI